MKGIITSRQEFFFPDSPLGVLPGSLRVVSAKNGKIGVQILFECAAQSGFVRVCGEGFDLELYQMIAIPVEYNTGDGENQGGAMVILSDERPEYAIRKAPFWVYDCLKPVDGEAIPAKDGRVSAYICLSPKADTPAGTHLL